MLMAVKDSFDWRPTASFTNLSYRAQLFAKIREFFAERQVLEVDTPLLAHTAALDVNIDAIAAACTRAGTSNLHTAYLQTSPEFCMKRLLAAGSGPIYQLGKAFRNEEQGRYHNPEFTLLEWYRPGFDHYTLMNEMDEFLQTVILTEKSTRVTYRNLFLEYLQLDPFTATLAELKHCAEQHAVHVFAAVESLHHDDWLDILLSHTIQPKLGLHNPVFVYDYPSSQAALAKVVQKDEIAIAERFEVYFKGVELANGYHELTDASEQLRRFQNEVKLREKLGKPHLSIDERLLSAITFGLPECAGVAVGVDRLLMLKLNAASIKEVLSFTFENA